jgi:hypothetical protein
MGWCLGSDGDHDKCRVAIGSAGGRFHPAHLSVCPCPNHTQEQIDNAVATARASIQHQKEVSRVADEQKAPKAKKEKPVKDCTCGCGGQTKGGNYLPGHDSRHVSQTSAEALKVQGAAREQIIKRLPTEALQAKARHQVELKEAEAKKRAEKTAPAA